MNRKRLAIAGTQPDTRGLTPFDDPDCDIWVFNESGMATAEFYPGEPDKQWCKRWDAVIQIHSPEVYRSQTNWVNNRHWEWLQREHGPEQTIWLQEIDPDVPNARRYPLEEIIASVPGASLEWFSSSAAYAVALAIYLGYEEIGLYGLDMNSNTEYGYQLTNFVYWTGVCFGLGIKLFHLSNQRYFTSPLYGYEGELQLGQAYFSDRASAAFAAWREKEKQSNKLKSRLMEAVQKCRYDKIPPLLIEWREVAIEAGSLSAAQAEAEAYAAREDRISRQEFERRSAQAAKTGEEQKMLMYVCAGKTEYVFNAWQQTGNYQALQQLRIFIAEQMQMAYNVGASHGAYRENMEYVVDYDDRLQAAGGVRTLSALGLEEVRA